MMTAVIKVHLFYLAKMKKKSKENKEWFLFRMVNNLPNNYDKLNNLINSKGEVQFIQQ